MLATTTLTVRSPEALRARMEEKGQTIRSLARHSGSSPARIGQLTTRPNEAVAASTALAIAAALDSEATDLFYFVDGEALVRLGFIRAL